jgi:hypothetical protein
MFSPFHMNDDESLFGLTPGSPSKFLWRLFWNKKGDTKICPVEPFDTQ